MKNTIQMTVAEFRRTWLVVAWMKKRLADKREDEVITVTVVETPFGRYVVDLA